MITAEYLRSRLRYDPNTGFFTWLKQMETSGERRRWNSRFAETVAGKPDTRGHIQITIDGRLYAAHRLAWLYMKGEWPSADIDHKDHVKAHNWFSNLRPATRGQNNTNRPLSRANTSGVKGVRWDAQKGKWQAYATANGRQHHLGFFTDKSAAVSARLDAARELHGEFFSDALTEAVAA